MADSIDQFDAKTEEAWDLITKAVWDVHKGKGIPLAILAPLVVGIGKSLQDAALKEMIENNTPRHMVESYRNLCYRVEQADGSPS